MTIPLDAVVSATKDQVSTSTGTEVVILELTDGTYYGLNEVGSAIWERLQEPIIVSEIVDYVLQTYEVDEKQCRLDVLNLLANLIDHRLIKIKHDHQP